MLEGRKIPNAGVSVVLRGLVAANILKRLGIEGELRSSPEGCEIEGVLEADCAAGEEAKYIPPARGPDAFTNDVQGDYKREKNGKAQMQERKQR
jgi:hypothetical protein